MAELWGARGQYCSVSNERGDHQWLRAQVRAGDHAAFTSLYREHVGAVFVLAHRLTGSRALAEEVTSETFLAAWRARDSIEDDGRPLLPWLLGITARQSLNATRSVRRRLTFLARRPGELAVDDFADEIASRIDDAELIRRTRAALACLTRAESEVGIIREFGQDWPMDAGGPAQPSVVRPTYAWLDALPTDPDALLTEIENDVAIGNVGGDMGGDRDQVVFNRIGTLVTEGIVPPEVTAALLEAVTRIPGVLIEPDATDALGRSGIGVARSDDTIRSIWIFDTQTYEVLGTRDYFVTTRGDVLLGATAVLERGVADSAGDPPAAPSPTGVMPSAA